MKQTMAKVAVNHNRVGSSETMLGEQAVCYVKRERNERAESGEESRGNTRIGTIHYPIALVNRLLSQIYGCT